MADAPSPAENATQTVVEHGEASNLPDTSWLFRRALIFLIALAAIASVFWVLGHVTDISTLRMIARYSLGLQAFTLFLYVAGATASDVVRLVGAIRTTRRETVTTAAPPASISASGAVIAAEPGHPTPAATTDTGELPPGQRVRRP